MRMNLRLVLLIALGLELIFARESFSAGKTGIFPDETIEVNGKTREYRLVAPDSLDLKKPAPLVFAFHGLGDSKDGISKYSGLDDLAQKEGFIMVCPNALGQDWPLRVVRSKSELDFFDALCKRLAETYNIDAKRVYLTGMSDGAIFIHLLAAQRSEKIAAIAPHSGSLGILAARGIGAKRKYPVMIIHGDADKVIPVAADRKTRDIYKREGHEVEYVEVPGLGHAWAHEVDINDKIWAFFKAHPLSK